MDAVCAHTAAVPTGSLDRQALQADTRMQSPAWHSSGTRNIAIAPDECTSYQFPWLTGFEPGLQSFGMQTTLGCTVFSQHHTCDSSPSPSKSNLLKITWTFWRRVNPLILLDNSATRDTSLHSGLASQGQCQHYHCAKRVPMLNVCTSGQQRRDQDLRHFPTSRLPAPHDAMEFQSDKRANKKPSLRASVAS